jgi:hypothetical protein
MTRLACALITIFYSIVVHHSNIQSFRALSSFSSFSNPIGFLTNLRQSDLESIWGHKVMANTVIQESLTYFDRHAESFAKSTGVYISRHLRIMQAFTRLGTLHPSFQLCTTKRLGIVSS